LSTGNDSSFMLISRSLWSDLIIMMYIHILSPTFNYKMPITQCLER
jgi:hypothetical protein